MDKIWERNPLKLEIPLWRGWKNEWPHRTDKSRTCDTVLSAIE